MATLTEVADVTRKGIIGLAVLMVSVTVGSMAWRLGKQIWIMTHPEEPPPPTVGFGRLPMPKFPVKEIPELTYKYEIPQGALVAFGDRAKVYFSARTRSNLLALERAKKQATALGFVFEPEQIGDTLFRWSKTSPLPAVLEMDINTSNFTMEVSWETDPAFLQKKLLLDENQAINEAKSYFQRAGMVRDDLTNGQIKTTLLTYRGGEFINVSSVSEADFIRVDIFRAPIVDPTPAFVDGNDQETAQVLTKDPDMGLARVMFSGSRSQGERIVSAEIKYTDIFYDQAETYPVMQPQQAWEHLIKGEAYVATAPADGSEAVVRRVALGYYDQLTEQSYLLPMYVFYGDNDFVAYVPAVVPEWYAEAEVEAEPAN